MFCVSSSVPPWHGIENWLVLLPWNDSPFPTWYTFCNAKKLLCPDLPRHWVAQASIFLNETINGIFPDPSLTSSAMRAQWLITPFLMYSIFCMKSEISRFFFHITFTKLTNHNSWLPNIFLELIIASFFGSIEWLACP